MNVECDNLDRNEARRCGEVASRFYKIQNIFQNTFNIQFPYIARCAGCDPWSGFTPDDDIWLIISEEEYVIGRIHSQ